VGNIIAFGGNIILFGGIAFAFSMYFEGKSRNERDRRELTHLKSEMAKLKRKRKGKLRKESEVNSETK
jgi:hypothetical protein